MKTYALLFIFQIFFLCSIAQNKTYYALVSKADSLYKIKKYKAAALAYSAALQSNSWKAGSDQHYNAACCWAQAKVPDSAFFHLYVLANTFKDTMQAWIKIDPGLESLRNDKRWKPLLALEMNNKQKAEANLNRPLIHLLDSIYREDQAARALLKRETAKSGWESAGTIAMIRLMAETDSTDLIEVKKILDTYGWLGADVVGDLGNVTLFLVIQHADTKTQEHYLPMLREAVKNKKADAASLALMEDRVAISNGKKQVYGSQVGQDKETQAYFLLPLEDPDNVDKRRSEVGLQPLADYLAGWQIKWDVEEYKKTATD